MQSSNSSNESQGTSATKVVGKFDLFIMNWECGGRKTSARVTHYDDDEEALTVICPICGEKWEGYEIRPNDEFRIFPSV